ncbi:MAG: tyrosine-type recombinase/integrase [Actinobacteria bacterium]|nr:tyrosine-type recombinase/integrase [Actinomycetota bacterium]
MAEIVGLDLDDVRRSARRGVLRVYGKGARVREIPIHPQLRKALTGLLDERPDWPGADNPALFLNQRTARLSARGAHDIITTIAHNAGLDDDTTTHVLRHTFATRLVRGGTDLVIAAELLGHARLETTRVSPARPTKTEQTRSTSSTSTSSPATFSSADHRLYFRFRHILVAPPMTCSRFRRGRTGFFLGRCLRQGSRGGRGHLARAVHDAHRGDAS